MRQSHKDRFDRVARALEQASLPASGSYIGMEEATRQAVAHLMAAMFPAYFGPEGQPPAGEEPRAGALERAFDALTCALKYVSETDAQAEEYALALIDALPDILDEIHSDVLAAYEGDPAAVGVEEVILTYPAFQTIGTYRIAHKLYQMRVPILPRMLSEQAHRRTGIDIHPGAAIGRSFFIDHGTGVVIGETTTIGDHVKLYQNVTLGAKSFAVQEDGTPVKGIKRHPNIGDHVVVYAGATILGGETWIGDRCVIGGNVWLTHSLEPDKTITIRTQEAARGL